MADRLRIAFVKFGGLSAGGTERWLQMMAANLPRDRFAVDYLYCDAAPYIGSDFRHPDTNPARVAYMERAGVNLVRFSVGAKDVTTPTHDWVDTDFWDLFDDGAYDYVQTAKAGPAEYPYHLMRTPVVECVALDAGADTSPNIALSILISQWQRRRWSEAGGDLARSTVIPVPAEPPASADDLRDELGIPRDARVAGFHQRAQDEIFSPVPLDAFARVQAPDRYFVAWVGDRYREQAAALGLRNVVFVEQPSGAEELSRFLNTLDVFAHGRHDGETFGTVFAEAMMHGRPCLSHRSPIANAQPETMGPAGLFAEDVEDYAAKLDRLFADRALTERLGAKARTHAQRYYSLASCVDRLELAYDRLAGRPVATLDAPPAYARSDLGFLVAGRIDDPGSVAHHVLTGAIPDEAPLDLLGHLPWRGSYRELGSANTLFGLVAAARSDETVACRLHVEDGPDADGLKASVELNNWERRVEVLHSPPPVVGDADGLVVANTPEWSETAVAAALAKTPLPALLLRLDRDHLLGKLRAAGYRCWRVRRASLVPVRRARGRDGWYVCLAPDAPLAARDALAAWGRGRRRLRRRRMLAWPAPRVRRAVGAGVGAAGRVRRLLRGT